jgi:arylsulfatase A-like enzyme
MIKAPKLAPRIDDGDFQLVDVFPTVMDILGLPIKEFESLDGRSGMRSTEPTRKRLFFINPSVTPVDVGLPVKAVKVNKN